MIFEAPFWNFALKLIAPKKFAMVYQSFCFFPDQCFISKSPFIVFLRLGEIGLNNIEWFGEALFISLNSAQNCFIFDLLIKALQLKGASQFRCILRYSRYPKYLFFCYALFLSPNLMAQDSTRAFKPAFCTCDDLIKKGKTEKAIRCLEELRKTFPRQIKPCIRLAEIYYQLDEKEQALLFANQAIDLNANEALGPVMHLANLMRKKGDEALALKLQNRLSVSDVDTAKTKLNKQVQNQLKSTRILNTAPISGVFLKNLGPNINSSENEYLPTISLDGQTLIFTRNHAGNEDFFVSSRDSNQNWISAVNLGYPPNTGLPDGAAMLSADGKYLFYTRCDMRSPNGIESGGCDIAFSFKEDTAWSSPQYFGFTINTTAYEGQACISSDNKDLYFVSNREGGYGGMDIWVSRFENNYWSKPTNLGPQINTDGNETAPFIHPDNQTLYFSSDGHPGFGSSDLFVSYKLGDTAWKTARNLGQPINSKGFDGSIVVDAQGKSGYCASDRKDTRGGLDLYTFELYPGIQPKSSMAIHGFLTDKFRKTKLQDKIIYFKNLSGNIHLDPVSSNEGDASYFKVLQNGTSCLISVLEEGYRPYYKKIFLHDSLPRILQQEIRLREPGLKDTLFQASIRYDSLNQTLTDSSRMLLDSIFKQWPQWSADSAFVSIWIRSYYYSGDSDTDTTYIEGLMKAMQQNQFLMESFERHGIACKLLMPELNMLIYNDEKHWFRKTEIMVLEDY